MDARKREYMIMVKEQVDAAMKTHKVIITYARNDRNEKVGVVVAYCLDDVIYMGWSRCNIVGNENQKGDKFNRLIGLHKALFRAKPINEAIMPNAGFTVCPWSMEEEWSQIYKRAQRYFKQANAEGIPSF